MASAHGTAPDLTRPRPGSRARDWAEIQERTLVPLYEAVHERLAVGPATSLLGLGCRSGLALLLAAARGAEVAGLEPDPQLRELARARRLTVAAGSLPRTAHSVVTVFEPLRLGADPHRTIREAARLTLPGGVVVLAAPGPAAACESTAVLEVARRCAGPRPAPAPLAGAGELGSLGELAAGVGLRLVGHGQAACPFGYADLDSAVRGLLATGWFDAAVAYAGEVPVAKELVEALHPFTREDGTVRMATEFQYLLAARG
ncbi:class I SAM-dependent methyltransferase [Kitasatospora azatica]|uniref:class I SAM-dependent methyltransferase n=1 Tax=Kitasatospora azatica TaxID=58347 RepID=UPI0007C639FE|nr:methyltransferase domain-containing protein [Kitasatospora azatica]